MTTKRSASSQTDGVSAAADTSATSQADATTDAQQAKPGTGARARQRAAEAGEALREGTRHVTDVAARTRRSAPVRVRQVSGGAATRTRRVTGKVAAWARRNPKAVAGAIAGTAAFGSATWRRITRRGRR
ncbi:hypothetical protein GCM10023196_003250 [Actinoallomurus vinaceus]|uniref:DUF3618 domain-containing protein n=1 Tax=Actinoallomurus vinaceus TaxID=1080074 RepID=A0ABP8TZB9_9ACTN